MVSAKAKQNIVGPTIRRMRYDQKLTQNELAARIGTLGWDISRGTLSQIEAQLRCVTDVELVCLARALRVSSEALLPKGNEIDHTLRSYFPERPLKGASRDTE